MDISAKSKSVSTFINPSGFIEQHYIGVQTGKTVTSGVRAAAAAVKKMHGKKKPALMLVDLSQVTSTDLSSHIAAVKGMKEVPFEKIAIYGPLTLQILLNTLAIVADKYAKVHSFATRVEAVEWLRRGD